MTTIKNLFKQHHFKESDIFCISFYPKREVFFVTIQLKKNLFADISNVCVKMQYDTDFKTDVAIDYVQHDNRYTEKFTIDEIASLLEVSPIKVKS